MIDRTKMINEIGERHESFKEQNPKSGLNGFISNEVLNRKSGLLFLMSYLKEKELFTPETKKIMAKYMFQQNIKNWDNNKNG